MKPINISEHSYNVLNEFQILRSTLKSIAKENPDIIKETTDHTTYLSFEMVNNIIPAKFVFTDFKKDGHDIKFNTIRRPGSANTTSQIESLASSEHTIKAFKSWIDLLKKYDNLKFDDVIEDEYEHELYNVFKIVDEEADNKPFLLHQQIVILQFLNAANHILDKQEQTVEINEIRREIDETTEKITKLSKNKVLVRVSKILAKSFKISKKLGVEFLGELKKYAFKEVISNGQKYIEDIINGLN